MRWLGAVGCCVVPFIAASLPGYVANRNKPSMARRQRELTSRENRSFECIENASRRPVGLLLLERSVFIQQWAKHGPRLRNRTDLQPRQLSHRGSGIHHAPVLPSRRDYRRQ